MRIIPVELPIPRGEEYHGACDIPEGAWVLGAFAGNEKLFLHVFGDTDAPSTKLRYWIVPVQTEIEELVDVNHAGMVLLGETAAKQPYHIFTHRVEP
jgi:hypothetical protein